jgi:hypothetical protein
LCGFLPAQLGGTKPYGFLYSAAQMSQTAGTLGAIKIEIFVKSIDMKIKIL